MLTEGRERDAALLLREAAAGEPPGTARRAVLERWSGLLLVRSGREVEGTHAIERADAQLDLLGAGQPSLEGLFEELGLELDDLAEP